MNIKNIKRVRNHIAGLAPDRFNMGFWAVSRGGASVDDVAPRRLLHDCGTCGCIGGYTNALFRVSKDRAGSVAAERSLGLDDEVGHALFYPYVVGVERWERITPPQAVRVLDLLIETGKVQWERAIRETSEEA